MKSNNTNYNKPIDRYPQMSSFVGSPFEQAQRQVFGNEGLVTSPFERAQQQIFGENLLEGSLEERAQRAFREAKAVLFFVRLINIQNMDTTTRSVNQITQRIFQHVNQITQHIFQPSPEISLTSLFEQTLNNPIQPNFQEIANESNFQSRSQIQQRR